MTEAWYYRCGEEVVGPVTFSRLRVLVENGQLGPADLVRRAAEDAWRAIRSVPNLSDDVSVRSLQDGNSEAAVPAAGNHIPLRSQLSDASGGLHSDLPCGPATGGESYFCLVLGFKFGPMTKRDLELMFRRGELSPEDQVRPEQGGSWIAAKEFLQLRPPLTRASDAGRSGDAKVYRRSTKLPSSERQASQRRDAVARAGKRVQPPSPSVPSGASGDTTARNSPPSSSFDGFRRFVQPPAWFPANLYEMLASNRGLNLVIAVWLLVNFLVLSVPADSSKEGRVIRTFPGGTVDQEFFEAHQVFRSVWHEIQQMRTKDPSEVEWQEFQLASMRRLQPVLNGLKNSQDPAKVFLFRAGKVYLHVMLSESEDDKGHLSWSFARDMRLAAEALQDAGFEVTPL